MNVREQILWTACVTPFDASGSKIDYSSMERVLKLQDEVGNGILLSGSTGEGLSLTDQERRELVEFTLKLGLKSPVMVGVPSSQWTQAMAWMDYASKLPISAFLMTTPIYTKPDIQGQTEWFKSLLDKAHVPTMLYNIPSRAATKLHPKAVENLASHEKLWAIKDSGGTLEGLVEYKTRAPRVSIYCGDDYFMPAMAAEGAEGLVSVASNAWPKATRMYVQKCLNHEVLPTKVWWESSKALFTTSSPVPIKALLHRMGVIDHPTVRLPLSLKDLTSFKELETASANITQWEKENVT